MRRYWLVLSCLFCQGLAAQTPVPDAHWPTFGRDPGGSQFSPLGAIHRDNVGDLRVAWTHRSGDFVQDTGFAGTSLEVTPIFVNSTLYYCSPLNRVFALDGETGKQRWVFDPDAPQPDTGEPLIQADIFHVYCRGVAYWEDVGAEAGGHCKRRIYKGDSRGHVYAMDADTGLPCRDFGARTGHPGYVSHFDHENHGEGFIILSSPPAVVGDLIVVGANVEDVMPNANDGIVRAFHARTGALVWEFNPVPGELRDIVGGGNVWSTISVDPQRRLVFLPTTSLSTDYYGAFRRGGSPLSNAVVALDATSGWIRWHFQIVRHDLFDYDLPGHPLLVTIEKDGQPVDVALQQTKAGEVFVFKRDTGEPVFPIGEYATPASDIPGEQAAVSQPLSSGVDSFAARELTESDMFGLTPLDRNWCRKAFQNSRYDGLYTPPSARGSIIFPSIRGGGNWGGAAFDPRNNLLVVRADNLASRVAVFKPESGSVMEESREYANRILPIAGTPYWVQIRPFLSPLGIPCTPPPWGELTAIDMDTGRTRWRRPMGQARRWGITLPEFLEWGSPMVGGPMITAGGLVFIGAGLDHHIRALDVKTGEQLWKHKLPAPGMAVPMTYQAGGKQYVVIAAGGNSLAETRIRDTLVAFALN